MRGATKIDLSARLRTQFIEQPPGIFQIRRVKTFGKPTVNLRQHLPRFRVVALPVPQARQAGGGAQFPRFRALSPCDLDGPVITALAVTSSTGSRDCSPSSIIRPHSPCAVAYSAWAM